MSSIPPKKERKKEEGQIAAHHLPHKHSCDVRVGGPDDGPVVEALGVITAIDVCVLTAAALKILHMYVYTHTECSIGTVQYTVKPIATTSHT